MNLVIAEKPSVAQSIAKVIGATTKHDGWMMIKKCDVLGRNWKQHLTNER